MPLSEDGDDEVDGGVVVAVVGQFNICAAVAEEIAGLEAVHVLEEDGFGFKDERGVEYAVGPHDEEVEVFAHGGPGGGCAVRVTLVVEGFAI